MSILSVCLVSCFRLRLWVSLTGRLSRSDVAGLARQYPTYIQGIDSRTAVLPDQ